MFLSFLNFCRACHPCRLLTCRCCTRGGLVLFAVRLPCLWFTFLPPSPRPRSQSALPLRGRGRPRLFHARGFAPCIPGIRPPAALTDPAAVVPAGGGACPCLAGSAGVDGTRRGVCFPCRLPPLPLVYFYAPIPPTRARRALFPSGEGGAQGYFMQGASPLASPELNLWFAAKTAGSGSLRGCRPGSEAGAPGAVAPGEIK